MAPIKLQLDNADLERERRRESTTQPRGRIMVKAKVQPAP